MNHPPPSDGARRGRPRAVAAAIGLAVALVTPSTAQQLSNGQWTITRIDGDTVGITGPDGASANFDMIFRIFLATSDPKPAKTLVSGVNYNGGTSWVASLPDPDSGISGGTNENWGDGFDPDVVTQPGSRTANLFRAAASKAVLPVGDLVDADGITYQFAADPTFAFSARIAFDEDLGAPVITTSLQSTGTAWFSVIYLGAPASAFADTEQVWQPLVWQGRRFPATSYLTAAYHCPIPSTLVTRAGRTVGVVAHPEEFPFMPLPLFENSRFGVAVRNASGEAQPILAAPILGGPGSKLTAGQSFHFRMCPFVTAGDTTIAFERIARDLYDFRDVRHNQIGSLNKALENMVAYGMSSFSQFLEEEKGCSYATDAPGTVKNVSSLSPMDVALTTDHEEIWHRRAYPYIEYMLSRKKFLFTTDESQAIQNPSYTLEGPVAPISELVALNRISNGAAAEMLALAEAEFESSRVRNLNVAEPGATWQNSLHLYRATREASYLQAAIEGADAYIARRITDLPEDFNDPDASLSFWTGFAPRFIDLLLLHEATGEPRFLEASWKAARFFAMHCWLAPRIPGFDVTVNQGGVAPTYWYLRDRTVGPIRVPEESVPAWRVSAQGLTCESSRTSTGHRAIFMANYAPWFLRLAWLKDDDFLRDIARSAIVGRWMNFPGYHLNTGRTTVYEKPGYPLRPFNELSYNSFHFNHIWPLMSVALDYLVTDAETRSDGGITFEREFIEGYAYLQSSYYGMRPGRFHGKEPVHLWMPQGLAEVSTDELNYIAARGADSLCLAFTNQNFVEEPAMVSIDTRLVPELAGRTRAARVWIDNRPAPPIPVVNGRFDLRVPAKGIVSVVLDNTQIRPAFQDGFADLSKADAWIDGHLEWTTPAARALILNFGSGDRSFYFYLKDSKRDFSSLRLRYEIDGRYGEVADATFPWEFTVPLGPDDRSILFELEATRPDGAGEFFGPGVLVQDAAGGFRLGDSTATRRVIPGSTAARVPGQRLLRSRNTKSAERVTIAAPDGRYLRPVDGVPILDRAAYTWILSEEAPSEFTVQDAMSGKHLRLQSPDGIAPFQELSASADQRIESTSPTSPISAGWSLRVGPLGNGEAVRSLLRFDLGGLPAYPDAVSLKMVRRANHAGDPANLNQQYAIYQVARDFVNGEATWLSAATGDPWINGGGDVEGDALMVIPYNPATSDEGQSLIFPDGPAFRSTVKAAITNGSSLNLLIRSNREDSAQRSEAYFASSEQPAGEAPRLLLDYRSTFAAKAELVLDTTSADRFALESADGGRQNLRHLESGLSLLPGANKPLGALETGTEQAWTIAPAPSSRLILGTEEGLLAASESGDSVELAPISSAGEVTRWELHDGPDGTIRIVHTASGKTLSVFAQSTDWTEIPVLEDIRMRANDLHQEVDWNLAAGSISASDNFRSLLRFDLSALPPGFAAAETELALDILNRDPTSESFSHNLEVFRVTQPYSFAEVTWTTAGPGPWTHPGGSFDRTVLASAVANPSTVGSGQDLVFRGGETFATVVQSALNNDGQLDLLVRSDRENNRRSFFWIASKEDDGVSEVEGPRLRIRGRADEWHLALRPSKSVAGQEFQWVDGGAAGVFLQEKESGQFLRIKQGVVGLTDDQPRATAIEVTNAEPGSRLVGRSLNRASLWTWFGAVDLSSYPWCYHTDLGWIYLGWEGRDSLWGWLDGVGWIYTSALTYPLCFSQQNDEWMMIERLPDESEVSFTRFRSRGSLRLPAGAGFNVADWLRSGSMPIVPTPPSFAPADPAPLFEPLLGQHTRLIRGPGDGAWCLITHGETDKNLLLQHSRDLRQWWLRDAIRTADRGPVLFQLPPEENSTFWRVLRHPFDSEEN